MSWRTRYIKFEVIIKGPVTRMLCIFAIDHADARNQALRELREGESIYSLNIDRR